MCAEWLYGRSLFLYVHLVSEKALILSETQMSLPSSKGLSGSSHPSQYETALIPQPSIAVLIVAANYLGIGTQRSAVRIVYIGNEGWRSWSARYAKLDGRLRHAIHTKDTQNTLRLEIATEEGLISIEVRDSEGKVIFVQILSITLGR